MWEKTLAQLFALFLVLMYLLFDVLPFTLRASNMNQEEITEEGERIAIKGLIPWFASFIDSLAKNGSTIALILIIGIIWFARLGDI